MTALRRQPERGLIPLPHPLLMLTCLGISAGLLVWALRTDVQPRPPLLLVIFWMMFCRFLSEWSRRRRARKMKKITGPPRRVLNID